MRYSTYLPIDVVPRVKVSNFQIEIILRISHLSKYLITNKPREFGSMLNNAKGI